MAMQAFEVFVMVDDNGDYVVTNDRDTLHEKWTEDIGDVPLVSRVLALTLNVELPVETALAADVPAGSAAATLTVK